MKGGRDICPTSTQEQESHQLYLACKLNSARLEGERVFYLLLEPLGVLGNEVSHRPEPPESNSCDGQMLTRVADETNCDKKEVAHNFLLDFRTGRETFFFVDGKLLSVHSAPTQQSWYYNI